MTMKKILLSIIACLGLFGSGHAEVSDINLGYCGGQSPKSGIKHSGDSKWVSGAIYIPASTLNTYGGNQINGVQAGLMSKLNVEELKVWLRTDLDGENIAEQTITADDDPKIKKGWNPVKFDTRKIRRRALGRLFRQRTALCGGSCKRRQSAESKPCPFQP